MHDADLKLPVHPAKRHPLTGQPLRALHVRPDGRIMWPVIGAAPDDPPGGGQGAGQGGGAGGSGSGAGQGGGAGDGGSGDGAGQGAGQGSGAASRNATDAQGNDMGFPKDTPLAEMTDKEQAAYWRNNSRKHEGLWKGVAGDRSLDAVKADLDAYGQIQRDQQTPAEQALNDKFTEGKKAGQAEARNDAATAIFRSQLEGSGIEGDELDELVSNLRVENFVTDDGIDTAKLTGFAKRFTGQPGTGTQQRRRDFGAGQRGQGQPGKGTGGKAEAQRRWGGKQQTTSTGE